MTTTLILLLVLHWFSPKTADRVADKLEALFASVRHRLVRIKARFKRPDTEPGQRL